MLVYCKQEILTHSDIQVLIIPLNVYEVFGASVLNSVPGMILLNEKDFCDTKSILLLITLIGQLIKKGIFDQ